MFFFNTKTLTITALLGLAIQSVSAFAKLQVHTDNAHDLKSFEQLLSRSISAETNILALGLPMATVDIQLVPLKRSLKLMDRNESVCVINKIKTKKRLRNYLFSHPINLFLNRRLYQLPALVSENIARPVNLTELFHVYPERRLIVSDQLSYGDFLDTVIRRLPSKNKTIRRASIDGRGVIDMFLEQRGEYALLYPFELNDVVPGLRTKSYELADVSPYIVGHLMCSDTPLTKRYLEQVNARIEGLNKTQTLKEVHLKYFDKSVHNTLKKYLDIEF